MSIFLIDSVPLQTLAHLLYEAASHCGYVDPGKIADILGVSIFLIDSVPLQTLAHLLYETASDCGYVDPRKIEEILGLSIFLIDSVPLQTLAHLLYEAASDCGYVDPRKIEDILGVSREEADPSNSPVTTGGRDDRMFFSFKLMTSGPSIKSLQKSGFPNIKYPLL